MILRILSFGIAALLIALAVWQRESTDSLFWGLVFGTGALWCTATALLPRLVREVEGQILVLICLGAALIGTWQYWPTAERWWDPDVWRVDENARQGLGMIVTALGMMLVAWVSLRGSKDDL